MTADEIREAATRQAERDQRLGLRTASKWAAVARTRSDGGLARALDALPGINRWNFAEANGWPPRDLPTARRRGL